MTAEADVRAAAAAARLVQPAWATVPPPARARYLRRAAQAVLDDLDALAGLIARETGRPRTQTLLAELLPSVSGLHALADDGPDALRDRRLAGRAAVRRAVLVQAPAGVVGLRAASPWLEPVLEAAASLLAGNAVLLLPAAPRAGERIAAAFVRAGVPGELIAVLPGAELPDGAVDRTVALARDAPPTLLVLDGAPLDDVVAAVPWAAGGRVVAAPGPAGALLDGLVAEAQRVRVGDAEAPETELGPVADAAALERALAAAEAGGAQRLCGGAVAVPGVGGTLFAPVVLRGELPEPVPGPVLAVVEAASEAEAIAAAAGARGAVSVWTGDHGHGERIARTLGAEIAWVNTHGRTPPSVPVRLARHVVPRRIAFDAVRLPRLHDPAFVRARTALARLAHGRERERVAALRAGAVPLARTAVRVVRSAGSRR